MAKTNTVKSIKKKIPDFVGNRIKIGGDIRDIRERRGLSQEQLGAQMGISRSTVSKIESGKFNCSIDYLQRFGTHLNFDISLVDLQISQ